MSIDYFVFTFEMAFVDARTFITNPQPTFLVEAQTT